MKYDYLIVGAGLCGATLANLLKAKGKRVVVVDRRNHIGGNIYTKEIENIHVHVYGAHIFHTSNEKVWQYINRFAKFNDFINSPIAIYKGKRYNLPFNMNTFHQLFGVTTPEEARAIIEKEKNECAIVSPKNLEEQALHLVGKTVYETLIKGYTEKQWGRNCKDLPPEIIKRLPVRFEYNNNYFNDKYQGIPIGGYTNIITNMLDGIEVKLNYDYLDHKDDIRAEVVIYTGQIDEYFDYCFGPLEYRSVAFETEMLNQKDYQGNAVINYTEKEIPFTRIIEHKYFDNNNQEKTIISKEYSKTWKKGDEPYYPVNNDLNNELYAKYCELASRNSNIRFSGRLGLYKYLDMDDVIEQAFLLVDELEK